MYRSISQMESLESRTLFSVVVTPSGTFSGNLTPSGKAAQKAYVAASGNKKYAKHVPASIDLTVANNGTATGTLTIPQVGTYALGGTVLDVMAHLTVASNGQGGNFSGLLGNKDKKLSGTLTNTVDGQIVTGKLTLTRSSGTGGSSSSQNNLALAPGFVPNETPPPIGSGLSGGTSPGNQTGLTGGDNSGTGTVGGDTGSLFG